MGREGEPQVGPAGTPDLQRGGWLEAAKRGDTIINNQRATAAGAEMKGFSRPVGDAPGALPG